MGVRCEVIAPSLIPEAPGDRVKTDRRDCRRLARLHRAGELVAIRVPTPAEEAVRDLCRARADMVDDRTRTRHRLSKFLLRHDRIWRGGEAWTGKHERVAARPALRRGGADDDLSATTGPCWPPATPSWTAIEADLATGTTTAPFADAVARLAAYRGVARLGALTIASEVGDWRRFADRPRVHGVHRAGAQRVLLRQRVHRGHITKAGNAHLRTQLVESAWAYQHRPSLGVELRPPPQGLAPATVARSWAAQQRLCGRFRRLAARKTSRSVVTVAIARELAGFLWAEMTAA